MPQIVNLAIKTLLRYDYTITQPKTNKTKEHSMTFANGCLHTLQETIRHGKHEKTVCSKCGIIISSSYNVHKEIKSSDVYEVVYITSEVMSKHKTIEKAKQVAKKIYLDELSNRYNEGRYVEPPKILKNGKEIIDFDDV
jgi:hypothetical protein